jgi:methylenetetrahydrofolate--tRNA-(uracil-5-)-methyltransferase
LLAAINVARLANDAACVVPSVTTAIGSLLQYVTDRRRREFQPMNANYGLFPPIDGRERGRDKRRVLAMRARHEMQAWIEQHAVEPDMPALHSALP